MKISVNNMSQSKNNGTTYLSPLFCSLILCCFFLFYCFFFSFTPHPQSISKVRSVSHFSLLPAFFFHLFFIYFFIRDGRKNQNKKTDRVFFFPPSILSLSDVLFKKPFILLTLVIHKITTDDL